eukprot:scaffold10756_cov56-Isochrysis_galbana.AAC.1
MRMPTVLPSVSVSSPALPPPEGGGIHTLSGPPGAGGRRDGDSAAIRRAASRLHFRCVASTAISRPAHASAADPPAATYNPRELTLAPGAA